MSSDPGSYQTYYICRLAENKKQYRDGSCQTFPAVSRA